MDFSKEPYDVKPLGAFEITCGEARISDPCYELGTWCAGTIMPVKNGVWHSYVVRSDENDWGIRCAMLVAYNTETGKVHQEDHRFEKQRFEVGVDSGQAGIFDAKHFKDDESVKGCERTGNEHPICEDEPFYSICCDRTLSDIGAGVIPYGVVSSSGYGDGGYDCYAIRDDDNEIIAICIDFGLLHEEPVDENDYYDDEDDEEDEE
jgi:hypothetical protein